MRQQYHIRKISGDNHIWDVNKLLNSAADKINAIVLKTLPAPDYINVDLNELNY